MIQLRITIHVDVLLLVGLPTALCLTWYSVPFWYLVLDQFPKHATQIRPFVWYVSIQSIVRAIHDIRLVQVLTKSYRAMPDKWHGLQDVEKRYRQRYVDLIASPSVKETFQKRSMILSTIRRSLEDSGFLEVETPVRPISVCCFNSCMCGLCLLYTFFICSGAACISVENNFNMSPGRTVKKHTTPVEADGMSL